MNFVRNNFGQSEKFHWYNSCCVIENVVFIILNVYSITRDCFIEIITAARRFASLCITLFEMYLSYLWIGPWINQKLYFIRTWFVSIRHATTPSEYQSTEWSYWTKLPLRIPNRISGAISFESCRIKEEKKEETF